MSVLWSTASFGLYMMIIRDKYLEGSIFTNFYFDGFASLFACLFSFNLYKRLKMRNVLLISTLITILGCALIILFERRQLSPSFMGLVYTFDFSGKD